MVERGRALEEAATSNFAVHASWASSRATGSRVVSRPELTIADSGLEADTFNIVCGARLRQEDVEAEARKVADYFSAAGRPFSWWVAPGDLPRDLGSLLAAAGYEAAETELAMAAALTADALASVPRPEGFRAGRIQTAGDLAVFARINAENWNPPDPVVEAFYRRSSDDLLRQESPQRFYLGTLGQSPVAAVELTFAAGVVGVYGLSTREGYRGRGIATALLAGALAEGLGVGAGGTAVLQAAAAGVGLYRRLGFREFGLITEYKPPTHSVR